MSGESLFREPLANNPRRNEIVAIVRIYWLAAALAVKYPPFREPEGSRFSFYSELGLVPSAHVQAWLKTIHAAIDKGGVTVLSDSLMPDPSAGDAGYIVLAKFWQWLRNGGGEWEKTPEALWIKLRPETEGGLPAWLVKHRPRGGKKPGSPSDAAKNEAYLNGKEEAPAIIRQIHAKTGKVPTKKELAEELARKYRNTSAAVWRNTYLTEITVAECIEG